MPLILSLMGKKKKPKQESMHFITYIEVVQNLEALIPIYDTNAMKFISNDRILLTSYTSFMLVVSLYDVMHVFFNYPSF